MSPATINPFAKDPDRFPIWEMLMRRDFEAFIADDWPMIAGDFLADEFHGLDAGRLPDPDRWQLRFAHLGAYEAEWKKQAAEFRDVTLQGITKLEFLLAAASLREIDIAGERAMARKKFNGRATTTRGETIHLLWQTLYLLRRRGAEWKITGFVGYLPNP